jgi:hypothetical protein
MYIYIYVYIYVCIVHKLLCVPILLYMCLHTSTKVSFLCAVHEQVERFGRAPECSRMLTYAHVCSRMLTYAEVCRLRDLGVHPPRKARLLSSNLAAGAEHVSTYLNPKP